MAPTCPERELLADEESKAKFAVEDRDARDRAMRGNRCKRARGMLHAGGKRVGMRDAHHRA